MKIISKLLLILFFVSFSNSQTTEYLIFSDDGENEFLGCIGCGIYDSKSICNEFGTYGSEFNSKSIWNEFSTYGNEFSSYSPWNEFSSNGPKLVDKDGNFYGRFSINEYNGFQLSEDLLKIYNYYDGNLEKVRKQFCGE